MTVRKVEEISTAMGMELGLKKCVVVHMVQGSVVTRGPLKLRGSQVVEELDETEVYTYLEVEQLLRSTAEAAKRRIRKRYMYRLHRVWGSLAEGAKTLYVGRVSVLILFCCCGVEPRERTGAGPMDEEDPQEYNTCGHGRQRV